MRAEQGPAAPWEQVHMPVIVLRHGERLDYVDPRWVGSAARPWDPPLTEEVRSLSLHALADLMGCMLR